MTTDAIVIGSGPNGLAAAIVLARAGFEVTVYEGAATIGGGTRTEELTGDGLLHDVCSAVHPLGAASPFLSSLPLSEHGLTWRWPEIELAHPLEGRPAALLHRSLSKTVAGLGPGGRRYGALVGGVSTGFDDLLDDVLRPVLHVPHHPLRLARFGIPALLPATAWPRLLGDESAAALLAGCAAHSFRPLQRPLTSAIGLMLAASGHAVGWPVAEGGSARITDAMASYLGSLGGRIETGVPVRTLEDVPPSRAVLFDTAPGAVLDIAAARVPARVARSFRRFAHGASAFKLDLAIEGGVPWTDPQVGRAGTVHVGGTTAEIASAEAHIDGGRMPERPFVLVGQQSVADPTRAVGELHPVWSYAHVPHGYPGDATDAILDQIERFAPGVRDRVTAMSVRSPRQLQADNPNHVGGDIAGGANTVRQLVFRPRGRDPYRVGPGLYLCSASTPPGGGVHGMAGFHAANRALRDLGHPT